MQLQKFEFQGKVVEFEKSPENLMINATQMAKIFNKSVARFMRNDQTKIFIEECIKSTDLYYISIKSKEDLVISKQKSGTWMHRHLAIKFGAWLDPLFDLWIIKTIDQVLFGERTQAHGVISNRRNLLKEKEELLNRKFDLEQELKEEWKKDSRFQEVEEINKKVREINVSLREMDDGILQYKLLLN